MSFENSEVFTKENLDLYLRELSKEYKKLGGRHTTAEIILIGGAAVIENYGFREMTTDIDAILPAISIMKEAINRVGDHFGLPNGWMNTDFIKTGSYSEYLRQYSIPYKTFNQVLQARIVTGEYLIAMKLRAGRKYKNDFSDIVGILAEHDRSGQSISYGMIDTAVKNLYGRWDDFPKDSISFIQGVLEVEDYGEIYKQIQESETQAKDVLLDFQEIYPGVLKRENLDGILEEKIRQDKRASILSRLNEMKKQNNL